MKKIFFLLAMLVSVAAGAQVTHVEPVSATYTSQTVSFRVWWNAGSRDATHLSKVWVWVDYITINNNNTTSGNSWTRAAVSAASPTASITYDGSNRQGFWLQGNSGSYSAIVTVKLNITADKFNWCAYASDYPPNVTANNGTYTLRGTPPFILTAANGITSQTVTGTTLAASALTITTPSTIRDKTDCPGVFCPYQGSDRYVDDTHFCQLRTSGAKNWEAWIKDSKDEELYRIVLMPDNNWWLAQNIKYMGAGVAIALSGCTPDKCGRFYTRAEATGNWGGSSGYGPKKQGICPSGWILPVQTDFKNMIDQISSNITTVCSYLRALNSPCGNAIDYYGFASVMVLHNTLSPTYGACNTWRSNETYDSDWGIGVDCRTSCANCCNEMQLGMVAGQSVGAPLRCFRQL
ncbi:MAG: hypothetical protein LBU42_04680 [Prevotellaceae bacterium]|jgi:uncharacterized protein (TIGR02145 family)|nr:hypothetical protein [Prevotellaceae bacterium]